MVSVHRLPMSILAMVVVAFGAAVGVSAATPSAAVDGDGSLPSLPSVCVIMPTNSRPEFVGHALSMISRQDYPLELVSEVVIVDDSPDELQFPTDRHTGTATSTSTTATGLNYVHYALTSPESIGAKRNRAAQLCTGQVVVHWDDDDFYSPQRTRLQVAPIAEGRADLTLLEHRWTYFMREDEVYAKRDPSSKSWGPHFGTLAWRRSLFSENGVHFPDTSKAEDYGFAQFAIKDAAARLEVVVEDPSSNKNNSVSSSLSREKQPPLFVCVRHGSNTWSWNDGARQSQVQFQEEEGARGVERLDPADVLSRDNLAFAVRMRATGVLSTLAARREASPAPKLRLDDSIDPNFFNYLYGDALIHQDARQLATFKNARGSEVVGDVFSYSDWLEDYDFQSECAYSDLVSGNSHDRNDACKTANVTYDTTTSADWTESGGPVGLETIGDAAHGGIYSRTGDVTLTDNLILVYYTTLIVHGDVDANGHSIGIGAFGRLLVIGSLRNIGNFTLGSFGTLNVSNNVHVSGFVNLWGGGASSSLENGVTPPSWLTASTDRQGRVGVYSSTAIIGNFTASAGLNLQNWAFLEVGGDLSGGDMITGGWGACGTEDLIKHYWDMLDDYEQKSCVMLVKGSLYAQNVSMGITAAILENLDVGGIRDSYNSAPLFVGGHADISLSLSSDRELRVAGDLTVGLDLTFSNYERVTGGAKVMVGGDVLVKGKWYWTGLDTYIYFNVTGDVVMARSDLLAVSGYFFFMRRKSRSWKRLLQSVRKYYNCRGRCQNPWGPKFASNLFIV